jgi:intracellular septation protein
MKSFLDFFPILLFFGAYKMGDIYSATGVLMAATVIQMFLIYRLDGKLQTMHKVTLALVLGFGALTLGLHDERFIKWKPTVLYTGMALALAVSERLFNKNFLQSMLGQQLQLPQAVWRRLNLIWVMYSLFMASINAYVAAYFSTETWVDFKIWGYVFPVIFIVGQGLYIARHLPKTDESA